MVVKMKKRKKVRKLRMPKSRSVNMSKGPQRAKAHGTHMRWKHETAEVTTTTAA